MSLVVQENIVQLQIAIDDALFMQEVQSNTDFSSIKSVRKQGEIWRMICLSTSATSTEETGLA